MQAHYQRWIVVIGLLAVSVGASGWPCATSYTTFSQDITSQNERCLPAFHHDAVSLNCGSYHQTTRYTCGPAAVMSLMRCFGLYSSKDMNSKTELKIAAEMGTLPGNTGGTTLFQMVGWLESHGFTVEYGSQVTADRIIENVNRGIPTLLGFSNHWMLAEGYNPGRTHDDDEIIFSDSSYNINVMSRNVIDSMWAESTLAMNNSLMSPGIYIIAVPHR